MERWLVRQPENWEWFSGCLCLQDQQPEIWFIHNKNRLVSRQAVLLFRLRGCICCWLELSCNQYRAVVGFAPRQGGGLYVACLAVQHMVYVQPE